MRNGGCARNATEEKRFSTSLDRSWEAVQAIAWYYRRRGFQVSIPDPRRRPSFETRAKYGDSFDIEISRWKCEVKWRSLNFTNAHDYPYPTIYVDRVAKIAQHQIAGYFMLNKSLTHAALIRASTKPHWLNLITHDQIKDYPVRLFACPTNLAVFNSIG